jgi:malate synthase
VRSVNPEALYFVAQLSSKFSATRDALLKKRKERQQVIDSGKLPDFLVETYFIR